MLCAFWKATRAGGAGKAGFVSVFCFSLFHAAVKGFHGERRRPNRSAGAQASNRGQLHMLFFFKLVKYYKLSHHNNFY